MNESCRYFFRFCRLLTLWALSVYGGEYHWQPQESHIDVSCRGIAVMDQQTVWISGAQGRFSHTADGGQNWIAGQVAGADSFDFRDIAVFDKTIFLMAAGTGTAARIYRSNDRGATWELQFINPYPAGFFSGIAFQDSLNGLILSDPVHGRFVLFTTSDGGKSWLQVPRDQAPAVKDGEYAFAASGSCIVTGNDGNRWFASGGRASRIFHSADAGQTWQSADSDIISGLASTGIFSLAFRDSQLGLAAGGDYANPDSICNNLAITADGGISWKSLDAANSLGFISSIAWLGTESGQQILACGSGTSAILNLKGEIIVNLKSGFHAIGASVDGLHFWATGSDGRVARLVRN